MTDFTRTKEDIVHECGILPADFIHAGAKDKLTLLACLTPEQAFRLGHVLGFGKGMETGYHGAARSSPASIQDDGRLAVVKYELTWRMRKERVE